MFGRGNRNINALGVNGEHMHPIRQAKGKSATTATAIGGLRYINDGILTT